MQLAKFRTPTGHVAVGLVDRDALVPLKLSSGADPVLADIFEAGDPAGTAQALAAHHAPRVPLAETKLLAPIDCQEVWAAGVTYRRSRTARMEESADAGDFYDKVYAAPRPELFFKASPHRVVGPGEPVRIRGDARWSVPEPELTLVLNSRLQLVGFTVGNDMSARDIEGANPLYLPQAKVYDASCALGPMVTLAGGLPQPLSDVGIRLAIRRDGAPAFEGRTDLGQMARTFDDLIGYLGRDNSFPHGVFLLTGTGIVPPNDFTLEPGDFVEITIDGIGTLANPVVRGGN